MEGHCGLPAPALRYAPPTSGLAGSVDAHGALDRPKPPIFHHPSPRQAPDACLGEGQGWGTLNGPCPRPTTEEGFPHLKRDGFPDMPAQGRSRWAGLPAACPVPYAERESEHALTSACCPLAWASLARMPARQARPMIGFTVSRTFSRSMGHGPASGGLRQRRLVIDVALSWGGLVRIRTRVAT